MGRSRIFAGVVLFLGAFGVVSAVPVVNVSAATQTFSTPGSQSWTVPAGVTSITVIAKGASGQPGVSGQRGAPGKGAIVTATLSVTPGASIQVNVGAVGGAGSGGGGGGGGASDIRIGGTAFANRVIVAGGGGGGGGNGLTWGSAASAANIGGTGGDAGAVAGSGGTAPVSSGLVGGGGATLLGGGTGGTGPQNGTAGSLGYGGSGGNTANGGGSGGQGYYGGGGGAGNGFAGGGAGGGAGSSYHDPAATSTSITTAASEGAGSVSISYVLSVTASIQSSDSSPVYGASVTLTGTVSNGAATGSMTFFDGATAIGTCTLVSGSCTFVTNSLAVGARSITASYSGDSSYGPATTSATTVTVASLATSTVLTSSSLSPQFGSAVTLTGTVSPSTASGTVTFKNGSSSVGTCSLVSGACSISVSSLAVGAQSLIAEYGADAVHQASSSSPLTVTVAALATSTVLTSSSLSPQFGSAVTLTGTVSPSTASGTVTFKNGSSSVGTCSLVSGACSISVSSLAVGAQSLIAEYGADAVHQASSSSPLTVTVAATPTPSAPSTFTETNSGESTAASVSEGGTGVSSVGREGMPSAGSEFGRTLTLVSLAMLILGELLRRRDRLRL